MVDLIDRKALEEAMLHEVLEADSDEKRWDGGCWIRYKMFERVLASMSSVQSEQKKGKWIDLGGTFECSVCYERSCCAGNYCPDCGAEMEIEK